MKVTVIKEIFSMFYLVVWLVTLSGIVYALALLICLYSKIDRILKKKRMMIYG